MNPENLSDEQIVCVVRDGSQEKYREIIHRYQSKLTHYLRKFIVNSDELEDVLQDIFIKVFKNLHNFDEKKKFSSWIYRIAHNEAINSLKKKSNQHIDIDEVEYKLFDEEFDVDKEIDRGILHKRVSVVLSELKPDYREVLILYYFEELSYVEIGDILKIPVSSVGTMIKRGKEKLKAILDKDKNDE